MELDLVSVDWVPLVVTMISILGAVATYAYQRWVDRKTALIEIRRNAYRNYLNAFMAMSDHPEHFEDVRRRYYQSETELLVVGSDQVIQRVGALSSYFAETNSNGPHRDMEKVKRLFAEICRAMRSDCFEQTDLSVDEIQALVPIA